MKEFSRLRHQLPVQRRGRTLLVAIFGCGVLLAGGAIAQQVDDDIWFDPKDWFVTPGDTHIQRDRKDYDHAAGQDVTLEGRHASPGEPYASNPNFERRTVALAPADYTFDAVHTGRHFTWNDHKKQWDNEEPSFWDKMHYYTVDFAGDRNDGSADNGAMLASEYLFHGRVAATERVPIRGEKDHMVAKVVSRDGRTIVADLGPDLDSPVLNIKPGDDVTIRGRKGTIDNKLVILATHISADDVFQVMRAPDSLDWFQIEEHVAHEHDHAASASEWSRDEWLRDQQWLRGSDLDARPSPEAVQTLTGTIGESRQVSIDGDDIHTFVRLNLANGEVRTLDLGPWLTPEDLRLTPGESVSVHAVPRTVSGAPVYVVRNVYAKGSTIRVSSPMR